jgi:hypothetical protein
LTKAFAFAILNYMNETPTINVSGCATETLAPAVYPLGTALYKIASTGKKWQWSIDVVDKGDFSEIVTTSGTVGGRLTVTPIPVYNGKNIGKTNETTHYTQAVMEALAKAELKLRGEYRYTIDENHKVQTLRSGIQAPMKAHKYDPLQVQGGKTLDQMKIRGEMVFAQPKYDGNRSVKQVRGRMGEFPLEIVQKDLDSMDLGVMSFEELAKKYTVVQSFTNKGDLVETPPQIARELAMDFYTFISEQCQDTCSQDMGFGSTEEFISTFDKTFEFDGELYIHGLPVATISGLVRKGSVQKNDEDQKLYDSIKLHVYDVYSDDPYEKRYEFLEMFFGGKPDGSFIELSPNDEIEAQEDIIDEKLMYWMELGYEGLMLRRKGMPYEHKRTWQLCKYKTFIDGEYECVGMLEDSRGGFVGSFIMKTEPYIDRDGKEKDTFRAGVKDLPHNISAEIWANKEQYVGRWATIRYQCFTKYGVPFFPKLVEFRTDKSVEEMAETKGIFGIEEAAAMPNICPACNEAYCEGFAAECKEAQKE